MKRFGCLILGLIALSPFDAQGGPRGQMAAPVIQPPGPLTRKARSHISIDVKLPGKATGGCFLEKVTKDGKTVEALKNMVYQAATGEFAWQPTESQVGVYEITFAPLLGDAGGPVASVTITVRARAICAGGGKVCKLLDRWYGRGTAAGNTGDFYDNRDNGHSRLNTDRLFPQIDRITYDVNNRKLTWHWRILRGDRQKIEIVPKNDAHSIVELRVAYQARRPIVKGAKLQSNRVDIGAFVHNGSYYSGPGFVTFYTLDREDRTYTEKGRLVEIDYMARSSTIDFAAITDWAVFLRTILDDDHALATRLLKQPFELSELVRLGEIAREYQPRYDQAKESPQESKKASAKAWGEANRFLRETKVDSAHSVADRLLAELNAIKNDTSFFIRHAEPIRKLARSHPAAVGQPSVEAMIEELQELGILKQTSAGLRLNPLLAGNAPAGARLTGFQRSRLQRVQLEIFNQLLFADFMNQPVMVNFCDNSITAAKPWCDRYRYAADGTCLGWSRWNGGEKTEFSAEGHRIVAKDAMGRATKVRTVIYRSHRSNPRQRWKLEYLDGDEIIDIAYRSPEDYVGAPSRRKKIEENSSVD